jgi:plastocyanin
MSRRISVIAVIAVVVVAAVVLVIAESGGGGTSSASTSAPAASMPARPTGQGDVLKPSADPGGQLRFNPSTLTAAPGKVTLVMTNPSSAGMEHGVAIDGNGVDQDGPIVEPGSTSTLTVSLKKGTYTYYCPVPGHRQAGMVGTLTVK